MDEGEDVGEDERKKSEQVVRKKLNVDLSEYESLDKIVLNVHQRIAERKEKAPKTVVEEIEEKKTGIERQLEDSDKVLSDLKQLGDELVTNIKIANEKREVLRRNNEAIKREKLLQSLEDESVLAMAKLEAISSKWTELEELKEPMGLYEELELQKARISELLKQKDGIIKQCQDEIRRIDMQYSGDLEKQTTDIYILVDRIDNQIEITRKAYKTHLHMLLQSIETERRRLSEAAEGRWTELYEKREKNEIMKREKKLQKKKLYAEKIAQIALEHEEITRATRIRLEKEAAAIHLELRNAKNNVMFNSEKLNYNYQVLQKCEEENTIIINQQKKRLNKLNETAWGLKRKINETKTNSALEIKKITSEIVQLQDNILDLDKKADNFEFQNNRKYLAVWDVNLKEATELLDKVLNIDRILHEQQLGIKWIRPEIPQFDIKDIPCYRSVREKTLKEHETVDDIKTKEKTDKPEDTRTEEEKREQIKFLKTILRKTAHRGLFLMDTKVIDIISNISEVKRNLLTVDSMFTVLGIRSREDIDALIAYFLPYAWCPNCSNSTEIEMNCHIDFEKIQANIMYTSFSSDDTDNSEKEDLICPDPEVYEKRLDHHGEILKTQQAKNCPNHRLILKSAYILSALREFVEDRQCKKQTHKSLRARLEAKKQRQPVASLVISKDDVEKFWTKFRDVFPEQRQKLWKCLEHGLNHYLKVLQEREKLDLECQFLRKQNAELKHLLLKYLPQTKCACK